MSKSTWQNLWLDKRLIAAEKLTFIHRIKDAEFDIISKYYNLYQDREDFRNNTNTITFAEFLTEYAVKCNFGKDTNNDGLDDKQLAVFKRNNEDSFVTLYETIYDGVEYLVGINNVFSWANLYRFL